MIPLVAPKRGRGGTHRTGWRNYKQPTYLYGTTSGRICYHWGSNPCQRSSPGETTLCEGYYVYNIQWPKECDYRICTTSYAGPTRLPTSRPTYLPTGRPTNRCMNIYDYCSVLAVNGYCYADTQITRAEIQRSCALSCGTCFNKSISPTHQPSMP